MTFAFWNTHGIAFYYLGPKHAVLPRGGKCRLKYHIFGHIHEEGLQRKAMLGGNTFLNVSYFEELRKNLGR